MASDVAGAIDEATGVPRQWRGLSRHLIARIFPCDSDGRELQDSPSVFGPITEANFEASLNWQSPFENTGPETKLPALMAMIQTGQFGIVANALQAAGFANEEGSLSKKIADSVSGAAKALEGKTGITRLNSRQVFSGMPPIKLSFALHFRAFADPEAEVLAPYRQLLEWALPKKLAEDGAIAQGLKDKSFLSALFPSDAPQMVGFSFGINRYPAMVIEHISNPIDGAVDKNGLPIHRAVQLSMSTLTALDRHDVVKLFQRA